LTEELEPRWLTALLLRVPEVFLEYQGRKEGGLLKGKAMNEEDAGRDRATRHRLKMNTRRRSRKYK
jgi:hypothetical protein